jgi:geranylgeranyl reductase family protein
VASYDAIVVGAGPAGSLTAYRLASAGASVLLLDKARFPRDKPCGGGVTIRALDQLPFGIDPVVEGVVDRFELRLRHRRGFSRRAHAPLALMTQRRLLDAYLVEQAVAAGAEFRDGVKVTSLDELDAPVIVGADGANGVCGRGLDTAREHGVALEGNLDNEAVDAERYARRLVLEFGTVPGGYGWVFPKGDHVNVGVGGDESEGPRLRAELRRMCDEYGVDADAAADTRGYRLPMRTPATVLARGNAALIGDAAGLVDPFSGDGMYEAFLSAQLAADAILAGDLASYADAVERRIAPLTRAGWGARNAFKRFPRTTYTLARLPVTFRAVEKLLRGELSHPGAARGLEKGAVSLIERVAKAAG